MRKRTLIWVVLVGALFLPMVPALASTESPRCAALRIPVSLSAGGPATETIAATLCAPPGGQATTVHLLLPGSTYGQTLWDFGYQPERYSYVRSVVGSGIATLAVDRFGAGQSSHPLSALVTIDSETYVVHQLVTGLRDGTIAGTRFAHVIAVGNSSGSVISLLDSARFGDLDGIIATGLAHGIDPTHLAALAANHQPAVLDARLRPRGLDPGYATFTHTQWMHGSHADQALVQYDDVTKEAVSMASQLGVLRAIAGIVTTPDVWEAAIGVVRAPVLIALGGEDALFCSPLGLDCADTNALLAQEAPFYRHTLRLDVFVQPDAGHVNTIEPNAHLFYEAAARWTAAVIGP